MALPAALTDTAPCFQAGVAAIRSERVNPASHSDRCAIAQDRARVVGSVWVAASGLRLEGGAILGGSDGVPAALGFGDAPGVTRIEIAAVEDGRWDMGDEVGAGIFTLGTSRQASSLGCDPS